MPDKRTHRGPHPEDAKLFAPGQIPSLKQAVADFSLLLTKGYAEKSSLKLVGDRFRLTGRQRLAVMRSACSDAKLASRKDRQIGTEKLSGKAVAIDGYNILITIEAALSGAPLFLGKDRCLRDLASIHGSYRKVSETIPAIELIAEILKKLDVSEVLWLFDSPVSNSGKLKILARSLAEKNNWPWQVELLFNPDRELCKTEMTVATSDSVILDNCRQWTNLTAEIIKSKIPAASIINLSAE